MACVLSAVIALVTTPPALAGAASLPSDTVSVRVAMTENDGGNIVVSASGGVNGAGVTGAAAVELTPLAGGQWSVSTGPGCTGPWTPASVPAATAPVLEAATRGALLTLCADNGAHLVVQGTVEGVFNSAGKARTVNVLPLEEYVADVVTGESPSYWGTVDAGGPQTHPWGFQALEAQAVAARSYVLASPGGYGGYATTCDIVCQTYRGTTYLTANGTAAVKDTLGEVMVSSDGSVADTEYSSSTGGYTSSATEGSPFTPVPDAGDAVCPTPPPGYAPGAVCNDFHDWSVTVPLTKIAAAWPKEGAAPKVAVSKRNGLGTWGGRAVTVTISKGTKSQSVAATTFATTLGLRSTYFTLTETSTSIAVTGHGWGHGVGMGQWGAFGYAIGTDAGQGHWTWRQIVSHYYAPATIATLPGTPGSLGTSGTQPPAFSFTRVAGATAAGTAVAALAHQFPPSGGSCPGASPSTRPVVLATDAAPTDALSSAPLERSLATGLLLTTASSLPATTQDALRSEGITRVDVVGGPLAVTTAVVSALEATPAYTCGGTKPTGSDLQVTRIAGESAEDTAASVGAAAAQNGGVGSLDLSGAYAGTNRRGGAGRYNATAGGASAAAAAPGALPTAVVVSGTDVLDAEAASALAYAERLPVLLSAPTALSAQVAAELSALHVAQVVLVGGPLALATAVVSQLQAMGVSVLRVAGSGFAQSAVELASLETAPSPTGVGWRGRGSLAVGSGASASDGLVGAVVAADGPDAQGPVPLLLAPAATQVGAPLTAYLKMAGSAGVGGVRVRTLVVLGGSSALPTATVERMGSDLGA